MGANTNGKFNGALIKKIANVLLFLLLGILSYLSADLYQKVNTEFPARLEGYVKKDEFSNLREDIKYLTQKVDEINCYLRDNPRVSDPSIHKKRTHPDANNR